MSTYCRGCQYCLISMGIMYCRKTMAVLGENEKSCKNFDKNGSEDSDRD